MLTVSKNNAIKEDVHGYGGGITIVKAEVVNVKDDPEKANRCQVRIIGHQEDQIKIPDENLIWARPMQAGGAALKGVGFSPRYLPGSVVEIMVRGGPDSQEYTIMGAVGRGGKDDQSDTHPTIRGHGATDLSPLPEDKEYGFSSRPTEKKKTQDVRRINEEPRKRNKSKIEQGQKLSQAGGSGKKRTGARFIDEGFLSIGKDVSFDNGQNPMKFIKDKIQNKGAVVPSMIDMVETLRTFNTNTTPHAIQSVGAGNYLSFISQLQKFFKKRSGSSSSSSDSPPKKQEEKTPEEISEEERLKEQIRKAEELYNEEDDELYANTELDLSYENDGQT